MEDRSAAEFEDMSYHCNRLIDNVKTWAWRPAWKRCFLELNQYLKCPVHGEPVEKPGDEPRIMSEFEEKRKNGNRS